jgi:3-hydroxyacyl-[acyl-carrier-protein] dehydratase
MTKAEIINSLPYTKPFLFVDGIIHIDENGVEGSYTFDENLDFYKGHFKDNPVTPGVILTEVMAQIGVVCLGIYLLNNEFTKKSVIALTSSEIEFLKPVYPKEKVIVISEKVYFRFGKLKCQVKMINEIGEVVCKGTIAGIIKS